MSDHNLDIAQLAIYTILVIPVIYILCCHRLPGLLGWLYLCIFCQLRIVGAGLAVGKGPDDTSAAIISSIGLSPLLLAISGVLHEARHYRNPDLNRKVEILLILLFHILVTTGLALVAVASGSSAFSSNTSSSKSGNGDENLLKVGIVVLLFSWAVVCACALFSLLSTQGRRSAHAFRDGSKLLYATLFALPFVGIRVMYSTIAILAPSKNLSVMNTALGLKLGLSFIPELIAAIALVVVGLLTRRVGRVQRDVESREVTTGMVGRKDGEVAQR
ncbi:hypothetical protein EG329_008970 [Mollisiaceae sp. DMI_Dod_QoI]|nr:hypothetical protein EG329_008970 [Helotiales sp. DMI_Dod_QoI]